MFIWFDQADSVAVYTQTKIGETYAANILERL